MFCISLDGLKAADLQKERGQVWADFAASEAGQLRLFGITEGEYSADLKRNYPRYIERKTHTAIVLFSISHNQGALIKRRLVFYITKKGVASIGAGELQKWFQDELGRERGVKKTNSQEIMLEIAGEIVKKHAPALMQYEDDVNRLENSAANRHDMPLGELFLRKRQLAMLSKHLWREREIIYDFRNGHIQMLVPSKEQARRLDDLFNSLLFEMNTVENLRDVLSDVLDIHHSVVSNRINSSIEKLTIVTVWLAIVATISAFPNTIATIFGIPYLPLEAEKAVFEIAGFSVYPWELVASLLAISTIVPTLVLIGWWKKLNAKEN